MQVSQWVLTELMKAEEHHVIKPQPELTLTYSYV